MHQRAIILFAHGSRDPLWCAPIEAVAQRVREIDQDVLVRCAYLELMDPDLPSAVAGLISAGANRIRVVPMFLGVGRHARQDLPQLMEGLERAHRQVRFDLRPAIGDDRRMVDLMAEIALS